MEDRKVFIAQERGRCVISAGHPSLEPIILWRLITRRSSSSSAAAFLSLISQRSLTYVVVLYISALLALIRDRSTGQFKFSSCSTVCCLLSFAYYHLCYFMFAFIFARVAVSAR